MLIYNILAEQVILSNQCQVKVARIAHIIAFDGLAEQLIVDR
jgi:hypothetical protein